MLWYNHSLSFRHFENDRIAFQTLNWSRSTRKFAKFDRRKQEFESNSGYKLLKPL